MSTTTASTERDGSPLAATRPKKTTKALVHRNVQLTRRPPQGIEGHVPAPGMNKVKAHDKSVEDPLRAPPRLRDISATGTPKGAGSGKRAEGAE